MSKETMAGVVERLMAQYNETEERAETTVAELNALRVDLDRARRAGDERVLEERARAERAEADNAALQSALGSALAILHARGLQVHTTALVATYEEENPGAALLERLQTAEQELEALRASVSTEPSGAERIHAALVAAGIPEEDEVSGVMGLDEHVGRALERLRASEEKTAVLDRVHPEAVRMLREHPGHVFHWGVRCITCAPTAKERKRYGAALGSKP